MLRKKKADEYWSLEDILKEQFALKLHDGTLGLMVHHGTNQPYLVKEVCEVYHQNKLKEQSENVTKPTKSEANNFQRGHRKSMFTQEQKEEIYRRHIKDKESKSALARKYRCNEKTIRNVIKEFG